MGKPIYVEPKIYDDSACHKPFNNMSNCHYCFRGSSREYCHYIANDMARGKMRANEIDGCTKWTSIDIAIVPHPDKPGYFMIEDRSTWIN